MKRCIICDVPYDEEKSSSVLKYTYCSFLCEKKDLGFSIDAFIKNELIKSKVLERR